MSCCWRPVTQQMSPVRSDGTRRAEPNGAGVIELQAYPDQNAAHQGAHRSETIYLVGWRTEHERIFKASDAKAAIAYKNELNRSRSKADALHLDQVAASTICNAAIRDLYAEA